MESDRRSLIHQSTSRLLEALDQTKKEGCRETSNRVSKFYAEWLTEGPPRFSLTTFSAEKSKGLIIQRDIPFYSMCEHHLLPFFGKATVAYIPQDKIIGLSKLARLVDWFARRPQNQERLTEEVAETLMAVVDPLGVAVTCEGRHMCMEMRGIRAYGTHTTTNSLKGVFFDDPRLRAEYMSLINRR